MNKLLLLLKANFYLCLSIFILAGCEGDRQESLYNPNAPKGLTPEITTVSPIEGALAGVGEVTITGKNFSFNKDEVLVFFDAKRAQVLEATPTQLVVVAPNIFGDSIKIKIAVYKVELYSDIFLYKLIPAVDEIGKLMDDDVGFGIAVDVAGNLYVSFDDKEVKKITPAGVTTSFVTSTTFLKANNMKMGPGNTIYAAVAAGRIRKIATIDPAGIEGTFTSLSESPYDLDFDLNGNIWVAAGTSIYLVKPDKSSAKISSFPLLLRSVRVFNGFLYISGRDETTKEAKIWRAEILGENLGDAEIVLDVNAATWLEEAIVLSITFSADGEMLLGTDHPNGIFVYREEDGSHEALYLGLIEDDIYSMSWDESHYLYAVRQFEDDEGESTSKILRIDMAKEGAPYWGRN